MSAGNQATQATVNNLLSALAVQLRDACDQIRKQQTYITGLGLAGLEAIGFGSAANPANPGGVSDAQLVLNLMNYLSNVAGCYYGTVQQGGSGGTGAILFNFDSALSQLWSGQ